MRCRKVDNLWYIFYVVILLSVLVTPKLYKMVLDYLKNLTVWVKWSCSCVPMKHPVLPCVFLSHCKPHHSKQQSLTRTLFLRSYCEEFSLPAQQKANKGETRSCAGLCNSTCADLLTQTTLFKRSSMESLEPMAVQNHFLPTYVKVCSKHVIWLRKHVRSQLLLLITSWEGKNKTKQQKMIFKFN